MALTTCVHCKSDVATNATTCPKCGAKDPRSKPVSLGVTFVVLLVVAAAIVGGLLAAVQREKAHLPVGVNFSLLVGTAAADEPMRVVSRPPAEPTEQIADCASADECLAIARRAENARCAPRAARFYELACKHGAKPFCAKPLAKHYRAMLRELRHPQVTTEEEPTPTIYDDPDRRVTRTERKQMHWALEDQIAQVNEMLDAITHPEDSDESACIAPQPQPRGGLQGLIQRSRTTSSMPDEDAPKATR